MLVDGVALGHLRDRRRDRARRLRRGAAGRRAAGARPRVARPRAPRRPAAAASRPATSSSASCAAPTPFRARRARRGSGTSAATGGYTERGIKALHGFGSERWRIEPEFAVKLDPGARAARRADGADDHRRQGVGADRPRAHARDDRARARARHRAPARSGCWRRCSRASAATSCTVLDRATDGPKPELVRDLGGTYHAAASRSSTRAPDIIVEATGASQVVLDAMSHTGANGIVCLTGISSGGHDDRPRRGRPQPPDRARERPRLRLGQREHAPLRGGGAGAGGRRPLAGWSA